MAKTLLLADDSVTIQKVVGLSFASEDVELITVDNGDDAITRARENRPDVILADVVMPGKDGYEVCEAIKSDPDLAHIPVLLLTGTFEAFDNDRAARCGAAGHVAKPFEAQTLVDRVHELLRSPLAAAATIAPPAAGEPQASMLAETPPETLAVPTTAPDAGGAEGFDFFDDEQAAVTPPPSQAATNPSVPTPNDPAAAVDLDPDDGAFAFGDDDLVAPAAPEIPANDMTVAMLPEEPAAPAAPAVTSLDDLLAAPSASPPADDLMPADMDSPAAPTDSFDFEIGGLLDKADPLAVGGDDLAQETILDPKGASGFDVSSSDLRDPLAEVPPAPAAEPAPISSAEVTRMAPIEPVAAAESAPPVVGDDLFGRDDPLAAEPMATPEIPPTALGMSNAVDESSIDEMVPATPEPAPMPAPPAVPEPPAAAMPPEPATPPAPSIEPPPVHATHDPAAVAGVALAEIQPRLREQLHDTLEKIAWESFGDVTEQIVRQALERVERIAWEVIPQMAETMIREEIKKLKGEE